MKRWHSMIPLALLLTDVSGGGRDPATALVGEAPQAREGTATAAAPTSPHSWQVGSQYELIDPDVAANRRTDKVQVVEFFWYACVHCFELESSLARWQETKADYIEFERIPSQGRPVSKAHARLYYTLEALGRPDLHAKVFEAIHKRRSKLYAADQAETLRLQLEFAVAHGVAREPFMRAFASANVTLALERADQLARRYRITGVPSVVVNGRYLTSLGRAESPSNLIAMVNDFAASERRR